jgi:hypothetical protein
MVNTAHSFKIAPWFLRAACISAAMLPFGSIAIAQSTGSFGTIPYLPGTVSLPPIVTPLADPKSTVSPRYRGPAPVVMFRGTPPAAPIVEPIIKFVEPPPLQKGAMSQAPAATPTSIDDTTQRRYSIANTAERDARSTGWNPANMDAVIAPPVVSTRAGGALSSPGDNVATSDARDHRGPVRRILQDTRRGLTRDLPEAVADAMPWVDRDAKDEPFDQVLDRVSDELHRAALADPEWALPAQREIRALSRRLEMLPAPPPLSQVPDESRPVSVAAGRDDRPFRPRPIWPGASGRPEAQVRPVTLVTSSVEQAGPRAGGVAARYIAAPEDDDGMAKPQVLPNARSAQTRARNGARGVPRARRSAPSQ